MIRMAVARYDAVADFHEAGFRDRYDDPVSVRLLAPAALREPAPPADRARTAPGAAHHPLLPVVACTRAPR